MKYKEYKKIREHIDTAREMFTVMKAMCKWEKTEMFLSATERFLKWMEQHTETHIDFPITEFFSKEECAELYSMLDTYYYYEGYK